MRDSQKQMSRRKCGGILPIDGRTQGKKIYSERYSEDASAGYYLIFIHTIMFGK